MSRFLLWLLVALPILLGIIAGLLVRAAVILWRAVLQGYQIGRGA